MDKKGGLDLLEHLENQQVSQPNKTQTHIF